MKTMVHNIPFTIKIKRKIHFHGQYSYPQSKKPHKELNVKHLKQKEIEYK